MRKALNAGGFGPQLATYWSARIDETASDVMGILNMGPAAAIGLIGYFRGLNKAATGDGRLRSRGPVNDPHPADILRGYLSAEVVKRLDFSGSERWSQIIERETDNDATRIVLGTHETPQDQAKKSAEIIAEVLVSRGWDALQGHALSEVQNWSDDDEQRVAMLIPILSTTEALPEVPTDTFYAAHVVAAAVIAALQRGANVNLLMLRMIAGLKQLHDGNPSWGPLFGVSRGDLRRDLSYVPLRRKVDQPSAQMQMR